MNGKIKTLLGIGALALLLAIAVFVYNRLSEGFEPQLPFDLAESSAGSLPPEQSSQEQEAVAAPDFTAYDGDGNEVKLSQYFGKPIVLNFWASWCPPCKSEMPHFNKVYGEMQDEVLFLMVDLVDGRQETQEKGQKYIDDNGFTFLVLFDLDQNAAYTYGIRSIPTTLFIDKEGNVAAGLQGAMDEETLRRGIDLIK